MNTVLESLASNQVLLLFVLVGFGMIFAKVRLRGLSLGAAAVLFFSIALSAFGLSQGHELLVAHDIGTLGLAVFAFAIGINSGPNFFHTMKTSLGPIAGMLAVFVLAGVVAGVLGRAMGMDWALIAGTFAGAVTNTPALAAAGSGSGDPATATVGYAIAYLFGVIGFIGWTFFALTKRSGDRDKPQEVINRTVRITRTDKVTLQDVINYVGEGVAFSRLAHSSKAPIETPALDSELEQGELLTCVGSKEQLDRVVEYLGHASSVSLMADRRYMDFRRMTLSDPKLAGKTVQWLDMEHRFDATVSRIRRGDTDMVAAPDVVLQLGDRIRVVAPTNRMREISDFFGDSARGLADINPVALGVGMTLGIVLGNVKFGFGDFSFGIGAAAGTLIVGLIMGRIGRIGKVYTSVPYTACQVLSEFGLLVFLAYAGTTAGSQILNAFTGGEWLKIFLLGGVITTMIGLGIFLIMRRGFSMGGTRLSGLLGGAQTQPAVLAFANDRTNFDPRVALGYAMVYPVAMIAKIIIAQVLGSLG